MALPSFQIFKSWIFSVRSGTKITNSCVTAQEYYAAFLLFLHLTFLLFNMLSILFLHYKNIYYQRKILPSSTHRKSHSHQRMFFACVATSKSSFWRKKIVKCICFKQGKYVSWVSTFSKLLKFQCEKVLMYYNFANLSRKFQSIHI